MALHHSSGAAAARPKVQALAHPARIRILEILVRGGRTVQELQEALTLEQPIVSQQPAVLRNQGFVTAHKDCLSDTRCETRWSVSCWTSHAGSSAIISSAREDSSANCNGRSAEGKRVPTAPAPGGSGDRSA
jgi:DNA-binding transcriptional ArsR family regulator